MSQNLNPSMYLPISFDVLQRYRGRSCSAGLQAGIRLIPQCPPEGGRYKNGPILSPGAASIFRAVETSLGTNKATGKSPIKSSSGRKGFPPATLAAVIFPVNILRQEF